MVLFRQALPRYSGQYSVSTLDLELAVPPPPAVGRSFSPATLKASGKPALELDTVLATVFYPANPHPTSSSARQPWLQRPVGQTGEGYARFLNFSKPWVLKALFWLVGARIRLPVAQNSPLADHLASSSSSASADTLVDSPDSASHWCGEIASRGYIVAAIEHRDGSGPVSVVRLDGGDERVVDYLRPEEHLSWPTGTHPQTSLEFRSSAQLPFRLAEVSALAHHLRRLNAGEGAAVARENRRVADREKDELGKRLERWKGRVGLDGEMVMAGHSFGGATTIQVLRAGNSAFPFVRGIALDPWADPIPPAPSPSHRRRSSSTSLAQLVEAAESPSTAEADPDPAATASSRDGAKGGKVPLDIKVPLLVINSESFTLWKAHYKLVRDIVTSVGGGAERYLLTLVGSIHTSFSDLPLLLSSLPLVPSSLARRTGARVDPLVGLGAVVDACSEFLGGEGRTGAVLGREVDQGDGEEKGEDGKTRLVGEPGSWRVHVASEGKKKTL
ncbi:uncharacterized protein RHOBADRAFT_40898 [Rhodotorula graminis WP1]|uniref:1-alkyl-2-acetylglycerophosphocholine esterase n=1 Tax=Rhodotorula graminis (strain WP1) TaxID=578459 RepID=A0A194SCN6_RHOGW|nr:uncharacterized protein RHOBADRAFT_40898 [Rhodotorula graminis WP1]KPV78352.1 hypothetical protein RHOBADRAFT_40898 [Rhodotorula graminis WP1]